MKRIEIKVYTLISSQNGSNGDLWKKKNDGNEIGKVCQYSQLLVIRHPQNTLELSDMMN